MERTENSTKQEQEKEGRRPIIAVDFDGTLCASKGPEIGEPRFRELNQISCCLDCAHPIDESGHCLIAKMFEKPVNPEHGCSWRVPIKRKAVLTNGDRIRQMTDEELAGVIGFNECKDTAHGYECPAWIQPHCDGECKKYFLEWLKQEVEKDDER